jgi:hypothetical protein
MKNNLIINYSIINFELSHPTIKPLDNPRRVILIIKFTKNYFKHSIEKL